jgi:DNA-binding NtrC family response regulator
VGSEAGTLLVDRSGRCALLRAPSFRLEVVDGPDRGSSAEAVDGKLSVGSAEAAQLRLRDRTVSRFHAELEATEHGIVLRDLGSTNGTEVGAIAVREVVLRAGADIRFGQSRARLVLGGAHTEIAVSERSSFGGLLGGSPAMRRVYLVLERAAPTTAPVLVTGESGTGKELAAQALHDASPRRGGPFEVVDCGSLPPTLVESELFGHERGAFTHALHERQGAFERADGGTLFLDELGELPLEVQPKLLRALGERQIRPIGARQARAVDVRLIAATNRDLRREVNAGRFRADLFYRLAVIQLELPPLRERLEDLALLVPVLLERIALERGIAAHLEPDAKLLDTLARHHWPGNVRELRGYLEQLVILRVAPTLPSAPPPAQPAAGAAAAHPARSGAAADPDAAADRADGPLLAELTRLPLRQAKAELLERFECRYLERLLAETGGNVAEAARRAGVDRGTLFRTLRRHGLKAPR